MPFININIGKGGDISVSQLLNTNRRANGSTMNSAKIIRERQRSLTFTVSGPLIPLALRRGGLGAANFLLCSRITRFEVFLTFEHVRRVDVRVSSSTF